MISIFKKKAPERPDLSTLVSDMHSHLVPGIDDGSPNVETSIELIKGLTELGFQKFIATPHILWDMYKNDKSTIEPAYLELAQEMKSQNMKIPFRFAAEYFLDDHVDDIIENEEDMLTIQDNWVLVEFSFISAPLDLKDKLFALQIAGYNPIIAHPERYNYYSKDRKIYDELKEAGYRFQLNLLSLTGYYGKSTQELAQYLVKKNYVDLLGTDLHHIRHLQALQGNPQLTDIIKGLQDSGRLMNHML